VGDHRARHRGGGRRDAQGRARVCGDEAADRRAARPAGGSHADVTYTYTALGPEGEAYVAGRTEEAYAAFMRDWEAALNARLERGATNDGTSRG
jgi:hypothetical protein